MTGEPFLSKHNVLLYSLFRLREGEGDTVKLSSFWGRVESMRMYAPNADGPVYPSVHDRLR